MVASINDPIAMPVQIGLAEIKITMIPRMIKAVQKSLILAQAL
jgi:hypothetical protein